jgi:hypothetical protein
VSRSKRHSHSFFGGLFIGLQSLGVDLSSLVVFGGAIGAGVGLGLQNVLSSFVAGLILLIEQPIRLGDRIETSNTLGDVVKITARSAWIRTNGSLLKMASKYPFRSASCTRDLRISHCHFSPQSATPARTQSPTPNHTGHAAWVSPGRARSPPRIPPHLSLPLFRDPASI